MDTLTLKKVYTDKSLDTLSSEVINAVSGLIKEYLHITPYKEQIQAGIELYKGNICDMKTGEGKTVAILIAAILLVRSGRKPFIVTSNDYLSKRDYEYSKELLEGLGIKSRYVFETSTNSLNTYESSDIIYATGQTLIFDYLRGIEGINYDIALIDEIDFILVESATHTFAVSREDSMVIMPKDMYESAKMLSKIFHIGYKDRASKKEDILFDLEFESDAVIDRAENYIYITERGYSLINKILPGAIYISSFMEIMLATLQAKYLLYDNVHYKKTDSEILLINKDTGRIGVSCHHEAILQTAIEEKESIPLTLKPLLENSCSYPVFFSLFKEITGISGTAAYVPYDFNIIFKKNIVKIKEHKKSRREEHYEYFSSDTERLNRISEILEKTESPVLLIGNSDKRSKELFEYFKELKEKNVLILENDTINHEEEYLLDVKRENSVLISNKIVGRGTDIALPERFEEGLTVILANRFPSLRAERQLIGRTGRNGRKGICYILTSSDDEIFSFSEKAKAMSEKNVRVLQDKYESLMFEGRRHCYIKSKLFFDQDKAVSEKLKSFKSYMEISEYFKNIEIKDISGKFAEKGYELPLTYPAIIIEIYDGIRPYYQSQFYRLCETMQGFLNDTNGFSDLSKSFLSMSEEVLEESIFRYLKILDSSDGI